MITRRAVAPTVFRILKHITICLFDAFDMIYVLQLRLNYYFANACQCRDLIEIISQADRKIRPKIRAIEDSIRREISNASSGFRAAHSPGDQILPDSQHTTIHGLHRLASKSEDRFVEWHSYPAKPHKCCSFAIESVWSTNCSICCCCALAKRHWDNFLSLPWRR